jgi:hypothetical protein
MRQKAIISFRERLAFGKNASLKRYEALVYLTLFEWVKSVNTFVALLTHTLKYAVFTHVVAYGKFNVT